MNFLSVPSRFCGANYFSVAVLVFGYPLGYLSIAVVDAVFLGLVLILLSQIKSEERDAGTAAAER